MFTRKIVAVNFEYVPSVQVGGLANIVGTLPAYKKISNLLLLLMLLFTLSTSCVIAPAAASVSKQQKSLLFWDKSAGTPAMRFEAAKSSIPELIAFVRQMPKGADLHNHVSGATYSDYILDSAEKNGLSYDLGTNLFFNPNDPTYKPVNPVSIADLKKNSVYLAQFLNIYSMRGWFPNTANGHDHFFDTFNFMWSGLRTNDDMILEVARRNIYENVQYLELMVGSIPNEVFALFNQTALDFDINNLDKAYDQAVAALKIAFFDVDASIRDFMDAREKNLKDNGILIGLGQDIQIRYLQQLKRSTDDMRNFFLSAFCSVYATKVDSRLVGVNLVQAEDTPLSRTYFNDEMTILNYIWNKMDKPLFSLHAGELVLRESPIESMQSRISDTIKKGHALRIGHGVSVAWEQDVAGLLSYMRDNHILVEICLSSNEAILGVKDNEHPFSLYRKAGVPTAICSDDEGVSRGNLTLEYVKAIDRYKLSYAEVKDLSRNSIEYSFLPGQSLYVNHDYTKIRDEFKGMEKIDWHPTEAAQQLLNENLKLEREYKLERQYVIFENNLIKGK